MFEKTKSHWTKLRQFPRNLVLDIKASMPLRKAKLWQNVYNGKMFISYLKAIYSVKLRCVLLVTLMIISALFTPTLQAYFEPYFSVPERLASLKALFLSLGGAMIGATAIAFSLIMFAMQVNVERMPHGLFRKFSSDVWLLGAFVSTFTLAVIISGFSLITDNSWVAGAILVTAWCLSLIVLLFVLAYRRALVLISPTMQLGLVVAETKRNFKACDNAIKRTKQIFQAATASNANADEDIGRKYDMGRVSYFKEYPDWTASAEQAISYCTTFSRRYAEQGDHEVSRVALDGIVLINKHYISTKGKTFFSNSYIFDNPLASDSFLVNTLENLRQNVQIGVSRKDEQFIEQNLHCLLQLTHLYLFIEYGEKHEPKSHAHLVSGYLIGAVESVIPHDMADVLIEGVSLLGSAAHLIVEHDKPEYIASISEKISFIACIGAVNKNYQPVSQVAVKQLAALTFQLLKSTSYEVRYAIKEVRDDVKLITEMYLKVPESPLTKIHSSSLAPYYSGTSTETLMTWLSQLANALSSADADNEDAIRVVSHIEQWADGLYQTEKELLLQAIDNRSQLSFDLIHWIVNISQILIFVSCTDVCSVHHRDKLRESAIWLIYVLSWIPDDEETIKYIERYQIADKIFASAVEANLRGCDAQSIEIRELLLKWTRKVGKYQTGWSSLQTACCGLACLNLILELEDEKLFTEIDAYISSKDAPDLKIRSRVSVELCKEAEKYRSGYGHGHISMEMTRVDQDRLRVLLLGIAEHLCPEIQNLRSESIQRSNDD